MHSIQGICLVEMIGFCRPILCVAFVCALYLHYQIWGEKSPVAFTAAGWADDSAQTGLTSSWSIASAKQLSSWPLPPLLPFKILQGSGPL